MMSDRRRDQSNMLISISSEASSDSDDSVSSPERLMDDDTDFFMVQANDSQSSLGVTNLRDMSVSVDLERERRISPITRLPPELLLAIFAKLTSSTDLRNCMLVSYHWALHTIGILWHRPLCNKWSNLLSVVHSLSSTGFFPYHELVRRLNLSALSDKISDGSVQPFMHCKRIERLTLTGCSKLTDHGVSNLVFGNKHLQALDVTDLDALTDHTLFAIADNCPRLQGLNITNCHNITDESLTAVSEQCRQLKRLKLNNIHRTTDCSIISFANNCRAILEIDLHNCGLISSRSVTALLANLANLRELRLAHCIEVSDSAFLDLPLPLEFDSLRILDLTACEHVHDEGISRVINATPRLRNLVLAKCKNITDRAVMSICRLGKNLHYIHLGHCVNLSDNAVIALVKHCNRIRYIDLACCHRLTDISVHHLAGLPKLRRIGLVKCQQLTDSSILALARGPYIQTPNGKLAAPPSLCSLERVHLSYCVNLTLHGIHQLLHHCPRLTHLSLTGVQAFLREDLTRFCRDAPPEFTHPQRDVFCVFSGEGVGRLRDYLNRLARDQEEKDAAEAESIVDGEDSAGGDAVSDDGTIGEDREEETVVGRNIRRPWLMTNAYVGHFPSITPSPPSPPPIRHSAPWEPVPMDLNPHRIIQATSAFAAAFEERHEVPLGDPRTSRMIYPPRPSEHSRISSLSDMSPETSGARAIYYGDYGLGTTSEPSASGFDEERRRRSAHMFGGRGLPGSRMSLIGVPGEIMHRSEEMLRQGSSEVPNSPVDFAGSAGVCGGSGENLRTEIGNADVRRTEIDRLTADQTLRLQMMRQLRDQMLGDGERERRAQHLDRIGANAMLDGRAAQGERQDEIGGTLREAVRRHIIQQRQTSNPEYQADAHGGPRTGANSRAAPRTAPGERPTAHAETADLAGMINEQYLSLDRQGTRQEQWSMRESESQRQLQLWFERQRDSMHRMQADESGLRQTEDAMLLPVSEPHPSYEDGDARESGNRNVGE